jgi:hypothetical protein
VTLLCLFSLENDVKNVSSKSNKQKNFEKIGSFSLLSWQSRTKIAGPGAGSGSIGQRRGSSSVPKYHGSTKQYKTVKI